MMDRYLFLDIDGVLNGFDTVNQHQFAALYEAYQRRYSDDIAFNFALIELDAVELLNRLLDCTGVRVVVSSSWRNCPFLPEVLSLAGLRHRLYDRTPYTDGFRGNDIRRWLQSVERPCSILILDDEPDLHPDQLERLLRTDGRVGLTDSDVAKAIYMGWPVFNGSLMLEPRVFPTEQ